jgi:hypothetical protein
MKSRYGGAGESRFQRWWVCGFHESWGLAPGFEMNAALLGAKHMPWPRAAASSAWWIRATLNPVECAVISAFDFRTDDESPLRTADTTARVPDKTQGAAVSSPPTKRIGRPEGRPSFYPSA